MNIKKIPCFLITVFVLLIGNDVFAQEILTNFQRDYKLKDLQIRNEKSEEIIKCLPFFDDFSTSRVYPNPQNWMNDDVYINSSFPIFSTNVNAATFDILNRYGEVYLNASSVSFIADYLNSVRIRLDSVFDAEPRKLTAADSVYLSFSYQPQGRGDAPESSDSLVLELGYFTGNMVFDYIDSAYTSIDDYLLANHIDSILPNDTLYAPFGCNENIYWVSNQILTWGDVLMLPCDSVFKPEIAWKHVWSAPGQTYDSFVEEQGTYFAQVMIPIVDSVFFSDQFQFRFYNYGSYAGSNLPNNKSNVDEWSIDFVYLNYNRRVLDRSYPMISFSEKAPTFLKRYQQMPYRQYRFDPTNAVRSSFEMYITNLDKVSHNTNYSYFVDQVNGNFSYSYNGGSCELPPFSEYGFQDCESGGCHSQHACPFVNSLFSIDFDRDTTSYIIKHYISDSTVSPIMVDSVIFHQGFYNYFSYDDGTPEMGYGVEPPGSYFASQFEMSAVDTLRGVQLLFNQTYGDYNEDYFDIVVWKDNNGKPGEEVYRKENLKPDWNENLYGFTYYTFDELIVLNGIFYVGIMQQEIGSINIGFDTSNDNHQYNFFNVSNEWFQSQYAGSIMLRPVVGGNYMMIQNEIVEDFEVQVFPNPANQTLNIHVPESMNQSSNIIFIYDLNGRLVYENSFNSKLSVSNFTEGLYLLRIVTDNGNAVTKKFLISR